MRQSIANIASLIGWFSFASGLVIWLIIIFTRSGEYAVDTGVFTFGTLTYLTLGIPMVAASIMLITRRWKGALLLWLVSSVFILLILGHRLLQAFSG